MTAPGHPTTSPGPRRCYLHVGTHKTGTTWLQDMLGRNADVLQRHGTLVPRAGRRIVDREPHFAGHHNLGMELLGHPGFVAEDGTLDDLTRELVATTCPRAVVSAESLSFAHHTADGLARLRDAVTSAGFEPIIVIYLRGQATYARSIYAMKVVTYGMCASFRTFCDNIFTYRGLCTGTEVAPFEYDRLLKPFENTFGKDAIVASAFELHADSRNIMQRFLSTIQAAPLDPEAFETSSYLNARGTVATVMDALHANRARRFPGLTSPQTIASQMSISQETLERQFDPLDVDVSRRFYDEFAASNERLRNAYGVTIDNAPPTSPRGGEEQLAYITACTAAWKNAGP